MFDLTPLYRSTVGFDRLARMLDEASSFEAPSYPPYNIERRFQLADHVQVQGAGLENGLLHISLKREVPEALKPRTIPVNGVQAPKTIEARKAA